MALAWASVSSLGSAAWLGARGARLARAVASVLAHFSAQTAAADGRLGGG